MFINTQIIMTMVRRAGNFLGIFYRHLLLAYRSPFNKWLDKWKVFFILNTLYIKSKIYSKNDNKEVNQKIFQFTVSGLSYKTMGYLFEEIFLNDEYRFESDKSDPKIIDCGANIGMTVLYFKYLFPDCSIIAFEPNPFVFQLLQKNVEQNKLTNVTLVNAGLSSENGACTFYYEDFKGTLLGSILKERGGANTLTIQTHRLSGYLKENYFDLVKIDIEGAETKVINDLLENNCLQNAQNYIIEYHHRINKNKSNLSSFLKAFEETDFEYNIRSNSNGTGQFQDILIYCYKEEDTPVESEYEQVKEASELISGSVIDA